MLFMLNNLREKTKNFVTKPFSRLFSSEVNKTQKKLYETLKGDIKPIIDDLEKINDSYASLIGGEITYIIDGNYKIAQQFFPDVKKGPITQEHIDTFLTNLKIAQNTLTVHIDSLKKSPLPPYTKQLFLNRCEEIQENMTMLSYSVYIEAEKGGYSIDPAERENIIKNTQDKLWTAFGPSVSSNKEESQQCVDKMVLYFNKNGNRLTEEEKTLFQGFLDACCQKYSLTQKKKSTTDSDEEEKSDNASESILLKTITRQKQQELFEILQQTERSDPINTKPQRTMKPRKIELDKIQKNVTVCSEKEKIYLPDDAKTISLESALVNYQHEIGKHATSGYNANHFFVKGRKGAGYLGLEEGLAKLFEAIVKGKVKTLADIPSITEKPSIGMLATFICEQCNYDEAVKIITIYNKLTRKPEGQTKKTKTPEEEAHNIVTRRKRFVPYDRPGASTKDCLYTRGLRDVAAMFNKCTNIKEAYKLLHTINFAKLGPKDIPHTEAIKKELGINDDDIFTTTFLPRRIIQDIQDQEGTKKYPSRIEAIRDRILKKVGLRKKTFDDMHNANKDQRKFWGPYKHHPITNITKKILEQNPKK
ncbi:MAG: hypothetical protein NZL83_00880 [Candidatus Absconditabacterales bacterium]|nr:hypothetical protein [Candidatus Absconditabacterales bacterium]